MSISAQQLAAQKNISWVIAEKIAQKILTGEYPPESILPGEMELGEQFGVSRTAVREAVKTLAAGLTHASRTVTGSSLLLC